MVLNFGEPQVKKISHVGLEGPFGTHDTLRNGFYSAAHSLAPKHPLQQSLASIEQAEEARKMYIATTTLGSHMAVRLQLDKEIANLNGHFAGLKSKRLTAAIVAGNDEDLDVCDIFAVNPSIRANIVKQPYEYFDL